MEHPVMLMGMSYVDAGMFNSTANVMHRCLDVCRRVIESFYCMGRPLWLELPNYLTRFDLRYVHLGFTWTENEHRSYLLT